MYNKIKLYGFINPFGNMPSFLTPIFSSGDKYYVQDINEKNKIDDFLPIDIENTLGFIWSNKNIVCEKGKDAIYAFIFKDGSIYVNTRKKLSVFLKIKEKEIIDSHFTYIEVLNFMGNNYKAKKEIFNIQKNYNENKRDLMDKWSENYRKQNNLSSIKSKSDIQRERNIDVNGFVDYWYTEKDIENIAERFDKVYLRFKKNNNLKKVPERIRESIDLLKLENNNSNILEGIVNLDDSSNIRKLQDIKGFVKLDTVNVGKYQINELPKTISGVFVPNSLSNKMGWVKCIERQNILKRTNEFLIKSDMTNSDEDSFTVEYHYDMPQYKDNHKRINNKKKNLVRCIKRETRNTEL